MAKLLPFDLAEKLSRMNDRIDELQRQVDGLSRRVGASPVPARETWRHTAGPDLVDEMPTIQLSAVTHAIPRITRVTIDDSKDHKVVAYTGTAGHYVEIPGLKGPFRKVGVLVLKHSGSLQWTQISASLPCTPIPA